MTKKTNKSEDEWRKELNPDEFHITQEKGTERAFSGKYWDHHEHGTYHCVCCGNPLFNSEDKFDSGSGWPSFTKPSENNAVTQQEDNSHQMHRIEVLCEKCNAHLGHVFDDGPKPTGQRFCINSASLKFAKKVK